MNIFDYLKWRGDLSFDQDPLNEIDVAIFAELSYCELKDFLKPYQRKTILELADLCPKETSNKKKKYSHSGFTLLKALKETKRFKDMIVYNYVSMLSEKNLVQFSAMMLKTTNNINLVCFRGTDDTLLGWKEDLILTYAETRAQKEAIKYLNKNLSIFKKYHLIGHSKGGYLASYAVNNCYKRVAHRISTIYNLDGPGVVTDIYKKKTIKIVPEYSVFGLVFDSLENVKIVCSDETNISQHALSSWQLNANKFIRAEEIDKDAYKIASGLNDFFAKTNTEQRKVFTEELFKGFKEAKITKMSELIHGGLAVFLKVLKQLSEMDESSKEVAMTLLNSIKDSLLKKKS